MATFKKKRSYSKAFLSYGFTSLIDKSVEKPQCVICLKVLSAESMKPSKLREHLEKYHTELMGKDIEFFERKERKDQARFDREIAQFKKYPPKSIILILC